MKSYSDVTDLTLTLTLTLILTLVCGKVGPSIRSRWQSCTADCCASNMPGWHVLLCIPDGDLTEQVSARETDALLDVALAVGPPAAALHLDARIIDLQVHAFC